MAVVQPVCSYNIGDRFDVPKEHIEACPTLTARMDTGGNNVPVVVPGTTYTIDRETLMCLGDQEAFSGDYHIIEPVCYRQGGFADYVEGEVGTLRAAGGDFGGDSENLVRTQYIVRRLTPLECERLQGFPDGWTDIGEWVDSKGKKHKEADSPRYKALGNSIALPPWKWVLKRICAQYERDATMASLFDGIGGFPLIWEQLNGKGSCLWASEIEEFPSAVTKLRFGGD